MPNSIFVWVAPTPIFPTPLGPASGGTGISSYTIGDLLYASGTTTLSKLADVATGSVLVSGGVGVAPAWSASPTLTRVLVGDGTPAAPGFAFASQSGLGVYRRTTGRVDISNGTSPIFEFDTSSQQLVMAASIGFNGSDASASADLVVGRGAANVFVQRNGTNAQAFRPYGYLSGSREAFGSVQTALGSVTLSGATSATSNIIPVGCFVLGVATTTTTTITGATGYQVGDGSDADRWGDITGTAVGTNSNNTNSTANPTGYFAAASAVTLTAKTSPFSGGVVQVVVFYLTTGSA